MKYVQLQIMHFSTLVDKSALLGPPRRCRPWLVGRGGPTVIDRNKLTAFCHLVQSVQSLCLRQAGFAALTLILMTGRLMTMRFSAHGIIWKIHLKHTTPNSDIFIRQLCAVHFVPGFTARPPSKFNRDIWPIDLVIAHRVRPWQ